MSKLLSVKEASESEARNDSSMATAQEAPPRELREGRADSRRGDRTIHRTPHHSREGGAAMNAETPARDQNASEAEQYLLDFVALLILDVAHTHPRINDAQIALWLARVALGAKR